MRRDKCTKTPPQWLLVYVTHFLSNPALCLGRCLYWFQCRTSSNMEVSLSVMSSCWEMRGCWWELLVTLTVNSVIIYSICQMMEAFIQSASQYFSCIHILKRVAQWELNPLILTMVEQRWATDFRDPNYFPCFIACVTIQRAIICFCDHMKEQSGRRDWHKQICPISHRASFQL